MSLERLESLRHDMKKCVRCSLCKLVPMPTIQQTKFTSACPPVDEYHFHAYSGGGMNVMALALLIIEVATPRKSCYNRVHTVGLCSIISDDSLNDYGLPYGERTGRLAFPVCCA